MTSPKVRLGKLIFTLGFRPSCIHSFIHSCIHFIPFHQCIQIQHMFHNVKEKSYLKLPNGGVQLPLIVFRFRPIFQGFCTHSFVTSQPQGSNVRSSACSLLRWPICAWSIGAADHLRAMKKKRGCCLGYIGDDKLPSYVAIF